MKQTGYTTHQISKICSVTIPTVISWINQGKLLAYKTLGGHRRVKKKDLIHFLKHNNIPLDEELKDNKYRILVVDDEKNVVEAVKVMLDDLGVKLEIETANDGIEAGLKLAQFQPHLVILDAIMPGADGDRVVKLIRNNESLKDIKILVFTGYPGEGRKLLKLGADRAIDKGSKEAEPEVFMKEVERLLGVRYTKGLIKA
jgi:excisionase family DNA binding protein